MDFKQLGSLAPHPGNPRKIPDHKLKMLGKALKEFGDLGGIVFNVQTGRTSSGHQRLKVLPKDADITIERRYDPPTRTGTVAEGYAIVDGERFSYRAVSWNEARESAAMIAANQHGGEFDLPMLADRLNELDALNYDLELTGLDQDELDDLMAPVGRAGECDEDEVPEPPVEPKTKRGDIYQLGKHRLMCADSGSSEAVRMLMQGERATLMNTDPPYGVSYVSTAQQMGKATGFDEIENDHLKDQELQKFLEGVFRAAVSEAIHPNAAWYLWHAHLTQGFFAAAAAAAANVILHRQIIWVKPSLVFGRGQYHWRHEPCFMGWIQGNQPPFYGERNQTTIWELNRENDKIHPTQKPVALFEAPIMNHTKSGEVIYEPFSGSGSQMIAAEKHGRRCYGLELSPAYCDVIVSRWEKFTGEKAILLDSAITA